MATGEEAITLLRSIDTTLKSMLDIMRKRTPKTKEIAPDGDLDGKHGDPLLKFTPRDWSGESFKECRFSECPPELLDMVAESLDYFADKAEQASEKTSSGKPVAPYRRRDAARARGWAKRMRDGKHTPPQQQGGPEWAGDAGSGWA